MSWHLHDDSITAYLGGALHDAHAASVEAHLLACPTCRATLAAHAEPRTHAATWDRLADRIDEPRTTLTERLLHAAGVPRHLARLTAGAPTLRRAWLTAGTAVLAVALLASRLGPTPAGTVLFLITAAVAPALGIALTYGPRTDPAGELTRTAAFPAGRLLLLRTLIVLAGWTPVAALLAAALPRHAGAALLWLLPALALSAVTVALAEHIDPGRAAALVTAGWLLLTAPALRGPRYGSTTDWLDRSPAFGTAGQLACAALAAAAALVLARRHRRHP